MATAATPDIAIVIPIYRHSALADEAIAAALALEGPLQTVVIAVDDGCPNAETRLALQGWAHRAPGHFHHLHQSNQGLSAARNLGIRFALDTYPSIQAVFPLDADNLLDLHSLHVFADLLQTDPRADWFYPNFDMFGLNSAAHNGGPFALPLLAASNQCEAGSLIRRRIFDAGVWFDEAMRAGYEDWDFWLSASAKGFRGAPVKPSFFRYRKRPESMLSGSHGQDVILRDQIQKKHRWLYAHDHVAQAAADLSPRFAVFETGEGADPWLCTDPRDRVPSSADALRSMIWAANARPWQVWLPQYWVFTRPRVLDHLADRKLAASALWHLQTALRTADVSALRLIQNPNGERQITSIAPLTLSPIKKRSSPEERRELAVEKRLHRQDRARQAAILAQADVLMVRLDRLQRFAALATGKPKRTAAEVTRLTYRGKVAEVRVALEDLAPQQQGQPPAEALKNFGTSLIQDPANSVFLSKLTPWREAPKMASVKDIAQIVSTFSLGGASYPLRRAGKTLQIGFVTPIFHFGGVEKCIVALAAALRAQGVTCHLFVYGNSGMAAADWLTEPFETVHQLCDRDLRNWRGPQYLGTNTAPALSSDLMQNMIAPLLGMDAVVTTGSAALFHGLSALRGKGVQVASWEHLLETDGYGRMYGTPYLAVGYEGGLDLILTCSQRLASWIHANGVPSAKLLPLPNGPGFPTDADQIAQAVTERQGRSPDTPLRVGFLGRLDAQKGADRYVEIVQACRDLPIDFSITGSAVLGDSGLTIPDSITRYPAAYEVAELTEAFARLDVLLMPSRDEGLPLTIMEAQRVGVVPIATDVGAVSEAIEDGTNGFLIRGHDVVLQMADLLRRLTADPTALSKVRKGLGGIDNRWDANATALIQALERARPA